MSKTYIIYGYAIPLERVPSTFTSVFPKEHFPYVYEDGEIGNELEFFDQCYDAMKESIPDTMFIRRTGVDFADIEYDGKFTQYNKGVLTISVGVKLGMLISKDIRGGISQIPKVDFDTKQMVAKFAKKTNFNFAGLTPSVMIVTKNKV